MLAQRTALFESSATATARAAAKAAADQGKEIVDLTVGEICSDLAPTIRAGAMDAIRKGVNRYTDTIGMMELREALARKISDNTGQVWRADEVAVTTGAKQALFNAAMVLVNPGDEVIVPAPYWTTFPAQVLIAGGKPVHVDTRANAYVPRIKDIEAAITDRSRAIVLNTPNNPTGTVYDADTLVGIGKLAIERNLWIIFDECYSDFIHIDEAHHSIVSIFPEVRPRTLIVSAFSKSLALAGWRIGYLAGPKGAIRAVKALQSHTTSNPNVIAQHAVLAHLLDSDGSYESQLRRQLTCARRIGLSVFSALTRIPVPKAMGGFYFYLDVSDLLRGARTREAEVKTADEVVGALLEVAGVAAVSGTAFGDPLGLRLSYGIPHQELQIGLTRVVELLNAWE